MKKINIKRNSPTHVALLYLKMKRNRLSTKEDIYNLSPLKFPRPSKLDRSLDVLVRMGFAIEKDSCYTITTRGTLALPQLVKEQPSKENKEKTR
jgi:hypothetical protein